MQEQKSIATGGAAVNPFAEFDENEVSADILDEEELMPRIEYIRGYLYSGFTLLAAPTGIGKTWIELQMAKTIITGQDFAGAVSASSQGTVYFMDSDGNSKRPIRDRLRALGINKNPKFKLLTSKFPIMDDSPTGLVKWLEYKKKQFPDLAAVFIDNIRQLEPEIKGNDAYKKMLRPYAPVNEWAIANGVAVVGALHRKKGFQSRTADDDNEAVSGSNGITGSVSTILQMQYDRTSAAVQEDQNIILRVTKCREVQHTPAMYMHHAQNGELVKLYSESERAAYEYRKHPIRKCILQRLEKESSFSISVEDILEMIGDSDYTTPAECTEKSIGTWLGLNKELFFRCDNVIVKSTRTYVSKKLVRMWEFSKRNPANEATKPVSEQMTMENT